MGEFTCPVCNIEFDDAEAVVSHLRFDHGVNLRGREDKPESPTVREVTVRNLVSVCIAVAAVALAPIATLALRGGDAQLGGILSFISIALFGIVLPLSRKMWGQAVIVGIFLTIATVITLKGFAELSNWAD